MELSGLREAIRRQPFQPFVVRLSDGRSLDVNHPEYVAVGPEHAIVMGEDGSWSVVDPYLIVSLDYAKNGNHGPRGEPKRKRRS